MGYQALAVIDQSVNGLFIYDIEEGLSNDEIETFIHSKGHHLSNCEWGEFDGQIEDQRNE